MSELAYHEVPTPPAGLRSRWSAERRFFLLFCGGIVAAVFLGFARTFFLKAWYPEWARLHGAPEPYFYLHGLLFTGWLALLLAQPTLVAAGRVGLHRRVGWAGAALAAAMVVVGVIGALLAAGRPTGFVDVPVPPLEFLTVPLGGIGMFGVFVGLAVINRRRPQHHKRLMLLGSIAVAEAGVARWPFAILQGPALLPGIGRIELMLDLFLVPLVLWDLASRGRVHPATLWGGLALVASQVLRAWVGGTDTWATVAGWAVALVR